MSCARSRRPVRLRRPLHGKADALGVAGDPPLDLTPWYGEGMRVRAGIATAVLLIVATSVVAQEDGHWAYQENRNEMDDSVYRFVYRHSEDGNWIAVIGCETPTLLRVGSDKPLIQVEDTAWLRFDKGKAMEFAMVYDDSQIVRFEHDEMVTLFLENVLFRMQLPRASTNSGTWTLVRFDLLTFNHAWEKCPD